MTGFSKAPPIEEVTIGDVRKNKAEIVRTRLVVLDRGVRLDIRQLYEPREGGDPRPTAKGVNLPVASIGTMIRMLEAAKREAMQRGWLGQPADQNAA